MRFSARWSFDLPIIPSYQDGELIQSHLRRIADANHISMPHLRTILVGEKPPLAEDDRREFMERFAKQLGHPSDLVAALTFTGYLVQSGIKSSRRQFCPECLAQDMMSSALTGEPAYAICPVHAFAHLVSCPECRRSLSWETGSYFHCSCGFDLRFGERIQVNLETVEMYRACLEDRPLMDPQATMVVDTSTAAMARLRSTLQYLLLADHNKEGDADKSHQNPSISSVVSQWETIGANVNVCPVRLNDIVTGIEARLVYSKAKPAWAISRSEQAREAITWSHLRSLAMAAHRHVMDVEPPIDFHSVTEVLGIDPKNVLAVQLESNHRISPSLRAEIRVQLNKLRRKSGDDPAHDKRRLTTLVGLTRELRSVHDIDWLEGYPINTQAELFAFIAAGVLEPWAPVPIENWHVLKSDLERVLRPVVGSPWPDAEPDKDTPYIADFLQIFNCRVDPADWLGLSLREIQDRVIKLVRMRAWPASGFDYMRDELALPLGFCSFLSDGPLTVYGDSTRKGGLGERGLVSATWQAAAVELEQVCLKAQAHFVRLNEWQRLSASIAWDYSFRRGLRYSKVEAEVNAKIAKMKPHPHKALSAAIKAYEDSCHLH